MDFISDKICQSSNLWGILIKDFKDVFLFIMSRRQPKLDKLWQEVLGTTCVLRSWEESSTLSTNGKCYTGVKLTLVDCWGMKIALWCFDDYDHKLSRLWSDYFFSTCSHSASVIKLRDESLLLKQIDVFKFCLKEHTVCPFVTVALFTSDNIWLLLCKSICTACEILLYIPSTNCSHEVHVSFDIGFTILPPF